MISALIESGSIKEDERNSFIKNLQANPEIKEVKKVVQMRRGPGPILNGAARVVFDLHVFFHQEKASDPVLPHYLQLLHSYGVEEYILFTT